MSEPKLISPMLDDFIMGGVISDHDGVRCCPAMRKNSDDKYIVKIISVPASQTKLDALLLTGAYPDKTAALKYFKELADGIVSEKEILDRLSKLEGFVSYEACQIVAKEDETGFDVYLLGRYRNTLEKFLSKYSMTKLGAVNLGLDLCAGLAICRRSGYMCVDVKPSNIYITGDKEFCIGDLGFVRLNALKYESLPDKYRSAYTAPELEDAFAAISDTTDIYAVGMVLYQVFNDGKLPEKLDTPSRADEEMAQIILKACDPDPEKRWQDPVQMGQAIVSYMQKNGVNDTPLVAETPAEETAKEVIEEDAPAEVSAEVVSEEAVPVQDAPNVEEIVAVVEDHTESIAEPAVEAVSEITAEEPATAEEQVEVPEEQEVEAEVADEAECVSEFILDDEPADEVVAEQLPEVISDTVLEEALAADADIVAEISVEEADYDNLSFLDEVTGDVSAEYSEISDDISDILDQVDKLAVLEVPAPVVAPDPVEIKIPEPIVEEESAEKADEESEEELSKEISTDVSEDEDPAVEEEVEEEELPYIPKKKRTGLVWFIVLLILAGLAYGGYYFYQNYYLQPIHSLELSGTEDRLEVKLSSNLDESQLTVVCSDPHGNRIPAPVVDGTAVFSGLAADTAYTVAVEADGFHQLTGVTTKVYSTPVQTKVAQISVVTGSESGSVILSFTVEGPDSDQWNVIYNAPGEAERVTAIPSHMVTLAGLTVGKEYTFRLEPVDSVYLKDIAEINYVVKDLVCAENLQVTSCANGVLSTQWSAPAGAEVTQWTVRCYSDNGYDKTITTQDTEASFEGIDESGAFTVEVTAAEMSVSKRVQVSANSVSISNFTVSAKDSLLNVKWKASKSVPSGGWIVRYSVNGVSAPASVKTKSNSISVPKIPNGSYTFTITDVEGNVALGGPFIYTHSGATDFSGNGVKKSNTTLRLCKTPSGSSWSYKDIAQKDYVNTFSVGQKISVVVSTTAAVKSSTNKTYITYAIYDEFGKLVSFSHTSQVWQSMWYKKHCELDIPSVPAEVGTYNLVLLFNGMEVGSHKFAITN